MTETAIERIEREMREHFPTETSRLDRAAESFEEGKARLFDQQGRQIYSDEQHQERMAALLDKLDTNLTTITEAATTAIEKAEADLEKLEGADPFDKLTADQKQAASTRAVFVKEDCETLPATELVKLARAALAGGDKVRIYLYGRYLSRRIAPVGADGMPNVRARAGSTDLELLAVVRELNAVFDDGDRTDKRREVERRISSAQVLQGRAQQARSSADGSQAAALQQFRQQMAARW
jgi:hypothetical protein